MITTYKKLAALSVQIGQPDLSQKYLKTAGELHQQFRAAHPEIQLTAKEMREDLE